MFLQVWLTCQLKRCTLHTCTLFLFYYFIYLLLLECLGIWYRDPKIIKIRQFFFHFLPTSEGEKRIKSNVLCSEKTQKHAFGDLESVTCQYHVDEQCGEEVNEGVHGYFLFFHTSREDCVFLQRSTSTYARKFPGRNWKTKKQKIINCGRKYVRTEILCLLHLCADQENSRECCVFVSRLTRSRFQMLLFWRFGPKYSSKIDEQSQWKFFRSSTSSFWILKNLKLWFGLERMTVANYSSLLRFLQASTS